MIKAAANYLATIPPVFIDGCLYIAIAWLLFSQAYLGGDEAAKYISPMLKFWINYGIGSLAAGTGAAKMFRSTSYSEHQDAKKRNGTGDTQFITKPPETKT